MSHVSRQIPGDKVLFYPFKPKRIYIFFLPGADIKIEIVLLVVISILVLLVPLNLDQIDCTILPWYQLLPFNFPPRNFGNRNGHTWLSTLSFPACKNQANMTLNFELRESDAMS